MRPQTLFLFLSFSFLIHALDPIFSFSNPDGSKVFTSPLTGDSIPLPLEVEVANRNEAAFEYLSFPLSRFLFILSVPL